LVAHLQFFQTHKAKQKTAKEPPSQRTTTRQWTDKQRPRKKNEGITAPTQKAGFRVPKTVLWLIKHYFFKSSFVVKVPPFG